VSWDLAFWKPTDPAGRDPLGVYQSLLEDEEPSGLEWLPLEAIKARFVEDFPDIDDGGSGLHWEGAGSDFEVSWAVGSRPQQTLGVLLSCGWQLRKQPLVIERLLRVGRRLGCGVFDPQDGSWSPPVEPS
jgi:hypothetical protein